MGGYGRDISVERVQYSTKTHSAGGLDGPISPGAVRPNEGPFDDHAAARAPIARVPAATGSAAGGANERVLAPPVRDEAENALPQVSHGGASWSTGRGRACSAVKSERRDEET